MQSQMSAPLQVVRRFWEMSLVRGIVAIIFGLLAIFWPHLTFALFMTVFGIFAIVEGIILLGNALTQRTVYTPTASYTRRAGSAAQEAPDEAGMRKKNVQSERYQERQDVAGYITHKANRSVLVLEGVLSILCGILALVLPGLALYVLAAWALFKGLGSLAQMKVRGPVLGIIGALGIILFLLVLFRPLFIIRSLLWVVGVFSLIMGILLVARALIHQATTPRATRPTAPSY